LSDATEDNGCPWVVPGLHTTGTLRHDLTETGLVCFEDPPDPVPVPVGAGGIVVFSSLTPHCTGPNRTDEVRKAYIVQYAPDGAEVLVAGAPGGSEHVRADAPDRQFRILQDGRRVT
jgi:ectoine hydroxylase-related dioxygenase (phytanoyl-CoA dioxygenase family)